MKRLTKLFAGLLLLIVIVNCASGKMFPAKAVQAMQGNETGCDSTNPDAHVYSYPIMFDGQILDYADFKMKSNGRLSIVRNPGTANATEVPFYIYLSRNGKTIKACKVNLLHQPVCSVEIGDFLSVSKAGDVLTIIPVAQPDGKTKIILSQEGC